MVLSKTVVRFSPGEPAFLKLESGRVLTYVAPKGANPRQETRAVYDEEEMHSASTRRRNSAYNVNDASDDWEGVNAVCQLVDTIVHAEGEADFFDGKNVLEVGFVTGLPTVFALESGAAEVALHSTCKRSLDLFVRPTLARKFSSAASRVKFSHGDFSECSLTNKFDIILAPEVLNCAVECYENIHELLDRALTHDGVCFLSSRLAYFSSSGSLPEFLSVIARHRKFVPLVRWTSPRTEIVPRQIIQLTRNLNF